MYILSDSMSIKLQRGWQAGRGVGGAGRREGLEKQEGSLCEGRMDKSLS